MNGQISLPATEISLLRHTLLLGFWTIKKDHFACFKSAVIEKMTIMFLHVPCITTQLINSFKKRFVSLKEFIPSWMQSCRNLDLNSASVSYHLSNLGQFA